MPRFLPPRAAFFLLPVLAVGAGASRLAAQTMVLPPGVTNPLAARAYSKADVEFFQGMIPHHAQAVLIAGWAGSHGASPTLQVLCERIVVSQRDEIRMMQNWLRERKETVPDSNATHMKMKMNGMEHDMLMPGMLTEEELKLLDKARGQEWDRLFLGFMIKHHEGALGMVDDLFNSYGAAQDDFVFKFASDVQSDQQAEIERMHLLLDAMPPVRGTP